MLTPSQLAALTPVKQTRLIAGGIGGNAIALSSDNGVSWTLPNNQPFSSSGYKCAFDGKRIVMGGNSNIAYSDDFGMTWISTGFTSLLYVYNIIYISATTTWFAVGSNSNNQTMARSTDGINWALLSNTLFDNGRGYDVVYNGSTYIATGLSSNYPMAISSDGITWNYNTTYKIPAPIAQYGFCLSYDGSRYIFGGMGSNTNPATGYSSTGNISTSQDGITWTKNNASLPFDIRYIAYNGIDTYVGVGTKNGFIAGTIFYYWSNDLINWYPANNNLLGINVYWVDWNGTCFVVVGDTTAGKNIIYSVDGKNWTASTNSPFTTNCYRITTISY
jgi:hypothetical protein